MIKCNSCKKSTACAIKDKVDVMENSFCGRTEGVIIGVVDCPYHQCKLCDGIGKYRVHDGTNFYGDSHNHTYDCDCKKEGR